MMEERIMPDMLAGDELIEGLTVKPIYDKSIRNQPMNVRLMALSSLYDLYIPSQMSVEIYNKIYLSVMRSIQKKTSKEATMQRYKNYQTRRGITSNGIMGGMDSYTIIGCSGIGKSSAIQHAIEAIDGETEIILNDPYMKIVPCLIVQCPFDSSVKNLLFEILRKIDEVLGSDFYTTAVRSKYTTDALIGIVSQACLNNIGLLVVDEIQNVVNSVNGKNLVGVLTQLINNSGISICMVGTPESKPFFEQKMYLARRALGLYYDKLEMDDYFYRFCHEMFQFQYVKKSTQINDAIIEWLYNHSAGVLSLVVTLFHDAQEIAILNGKEEITIETLNDAYNSRMQFMQEYIQPVVKKASARKQAQNRTVTVQTHNEVKEVPMKDLLKKRCEVEFHSVQEVVDWAKEHDRDVVKILQEFCAVEVV